MSKNKVRPHVPKIKLYLLSDCLTERDIDYTGNDVNDGSANMQADAESCRSSCRSMDADYFTFHEVNNGCWCKSSNAVRMQVVGSVSGETSCPGEMSFPSS